jgi:hypothetical protein
VFCSWQRDDDDTGVVGDDEEADIEVKHKVKEDDDGESIETKTEFSSRMIRVLYPSTMFRSSFTGVGW